MSNYKYRVLQKVFLTTYPEGEKLIDAINGGDEVQIYLAKSGKVKRVHESFYHSRDDATLTQIIGTLNILYKDEKFGIIGDTLVSIPSPSVATEHCKVKLLDASLPAGKGFEAHFSDQSEETQETIAILLDL